MNATISPTHRRRHKGIFMIFKGLSWSRPLTQRHPRHQRYDLGGSPKVSVAALVLGLLLSPASAAGPTLQLNVWQADPEGTVREDNVDYDVERDLGVDKNEVYSVALVGRRWEIRYEDISLDGQGTVEQDNLLLGLIPIGPQEFEVSSRVDVEDIQASFYPLSFGPLELGATLRSLEGQLDAREGDNIGVQDVDEVVPMAAARLNWPVRQDRMGFVLGGQWVEYEGDRAYTVNVGVEFAFHAVRVGAGYRLQRYDIGADDEDGLDLTLDGAQLHLGWAF